MGRQFRQKREVVLTAASAVAGCDSAESSAVRIGNRRSRKTLASTLNLENRKEPMPWQQQKSHQHAPQRNDLLVCESSRLSPREKQVLELLATGKTTKEIAVTLDLSTATVGNHRKSICRKLNVHSTAVLICRAALGTQ